MNSIVLQRGLHFVGLCGLSLLIYALILSANPERYSLFKVAQRIPALDGQLRTAEGPEAGHRSPELSLDEVPDLSRLNDQFAMVFDRVMPAVVSIDIGEVNPDPTVRLKKYRKGTITLPSGEEREIMIPVEWEWDENRKSDVFHEIPGVGSGVFIDEQGYIVTNHHVVLDADNILVTTHRGERLAAELIGADSTVDIAILRIKDARDRKFPVLNFADSDRARPGHIVFAFGNPFGLTESITQGIINGAHRRFNDDLGNEYIQTDAVINPGNSGGPLTDIQGRIVGINVIVYAGQQGKPQGWQGISLALPSNRVLQSYQELMDLGERVRPYLGVLFNDLSPDVRGAEGVPEGMTGVLIYDLEPDSPAKGILVPGDIVLRIDGSEVDSASSASQLLRDQAAGVPLEFGIWRDRGEKTLQVELGRFSDVNQLALLPIIFSEVASPDTLKAELGLLLRELTIRDRQETGMPSDLGGIFLWGVQPDSPLAGHLEGHDMVHEVNGQPIWTEKQFYELLMKMPEHEESTLVLTRNRRRYYLRFRTPEFQRVLRQSNEPDRLTPTSSGRD